MPDFTPAKTTETKTDNTKDARKPWFHFHHDALHPECVTTNREPGSTFFRYNYDLCDALNMTRLAIVLEKMALSGWLDKREAELFHTQAGSLLALMRTANNRAHARALTEESV